MKCKCEQIKDGKGMGKHGSPHHPKCPRFKTIGLYHFVSEYPENPQSITITVKDTRILITVPRGHSVEDLDLKMSDNNTDGWKPIAL